MIQDKTAQSLLQTTVDELTAAMGWVELQDSVKATLHIRLAIGCLVEAQMRLQKMSEDMADESVPLVEKKELKPPTPD